MKPPSVFRLVATLFAIVFGEYSVATDLAVLNKYFSIDSVALRSAEFDDAFERANLQKDDFILAWNNPKPQQSEFMVLRENPKGLFWTSFQAQNGKQFDQLLDWAFIDNGMLVGGYTIKHQFERMKSESRKLDVADAVSFYIPPTDFDWKTDSICLMRSIGHQDVESIKKIYGLNSLQQIPVAKRKPRTRGMEADIPLNYAIACGNTDVVKCLVELGNDVNASSNSGATPLFCAAAIGSIEIMQYLLEMGARIDVADNRGLTPIAIATINDQIDSVALLLDLGANVKCVDNDGNTLAHLVASDNVKLVETLFSRGTDIDHRDTDGYTPIHCAALNGFSHLIDWYASKGCSLSKQNKDGKTAIDLVRENPKLGEMKASQLMEIAKENQISRDRKSEMR